MKVSSLMMCVAVALCLGANAGAAIVIPTNLGKGADAELRESDLGIGIGATVVAGTNRGSNTELATRANNSVGVDTAAEPDVINNFFPTGDRSSVMLMKFDIGALPAAGDSFWDDKQVNLRLHTRNTNQSGGTRLWNPIPGGDSMNLADYRLMQFGIRGLEPSSTYVDDDVNTAMKTDRVGNPWNASQYKYDWDEAGVTFYNAPGITPHCTEVDNCFDASIPNSDATVETQTLGLYDDFDANTRSIATDWHWPNEETAASYTSSTTSPPNLPAGAPLDFADPNGNLKQLLLDAKSAGRDTLTLMVHHNMDTTAHQTNVGINGTTPGTFLNQNYLVIPKEDLTENGVDNTMGQLSPQLRIFVPEPTSAALFALGLAACGVVRRRK